MISLDSKRRRSQKNIFLIYSDDCQLGEDKMPIFFQRGTTYVEILPRFLPLSQCNEETRLSLGTSLIGRKSCFQIFQRNFLSFLLVISLAKPFQPRSNVKRVHRIEVRFPGTLKKIFSIILNIFFEYYSCDCNFLKLPASSERYIRKVPDRFSKVPGQIVLPLFYPLFQWVKSTYKNRPMK